MEIEQILNRVASLKKEFEAGQARLRELEAEQAYVRETMLRISGAIQVLKELTDKFSPGPVAAETTIAATGSTEPQSSSSVVTST